MMKFAKSLIFRTLPVRKRFQRIYEQNQWGSGESASGLGSTMDNTKNLRADLGKLVSRYQISSIVDIACGDLNWMRHFLKEVDVDYTGIDIVPQIISQNKEKYESARIRFQEMNVIEEVPPRADLAIFRDCILHLSFNNSTAALRNIAKSGTPLILLSSYPDQSNGSDIVSGRWRFCNLNAPPFNLPDPQYVIDENELGKTLGLWRNDDLMQI